MSHLPNYLRAFRKRLGLSQDEMAFLLGAQKGEKICRYERFVRKPSLETALALEAILKKPVRELFQGLYQKAEKQVVAKAKLLAAEIDRAGPTPRRSRKRQVLTDMSDSPLE